MLCVVILTGQRQVLCQTTVLCGLRGLFLNDTSSVGTITSPPTEVIPVDTNVKICPLSGSKSCCTVDNLNTLSSCYSQMMNFYTDRAKKVLIRIEKEQLMEGDKRIAIQNVGASQIASLRRRRRRLQKTNSISDSLKSIKTFNDIFEFSKSLMDEIKRQSNKCWKYYLNQMQRGLTCSVCSSIEENKFLTITADNFTPTFDLQTCDLLIPNCIHNIQLQVNLSEFFRNILIVIMDKKFTTGDEHKLSEMFQQYYPKSDLHGNLEACQKKASCDNLCKEIIKFGSFDNPYIFGNLKLYEAILKVAEKRDNNSPVKIELDSSIQDQILVNILGLTTNTKMTEGR